ncbi:MAG: hypothetical protein HC827_20075 [Cyanobacteria bacterium RM1_2_2]|nr:hypothetical protein [Cyanobacteria bacterium RM1_2_2]
MAGKTHNYTRHIPALHYVIEAIQDDANRGQFYMTANGAGVKAEDYILLQESTGAAKYRVEQIDYYCGTPDYWVARLIKCS